MRLVTMNQLYENTSGVIQQLHDRQEPFILTRRGQVLAVLTPLPDGAEGMAVAEYLKEHDVEEGG